MKFSLCAALPLVAAAVAFPPAHIHAVTFSVDLIPVSQVLDGFNDGIDTTSNFSNAAPAGEAGGVVSVTVEPAAPDPQFQVLTPTPITPFSVDDYPFFRINSRGAGASGQVFPLPPDGATVVDLGNAAAFAESRLSFVVPGPDGAGLRIDPIGAGTGVTETFDYDYIQLDQYPTISLGEFDRDGGLDGWVANPGFPSPTVSAATSSITSTTASNDPTITLGGLSVDTSLYQVIEFRFAVDPLSTSRFEFFWGTDLFPGPAGGQSIAITDELVRDGDFHTYRFDMGDEPAWSGTLTLLRIDPLADADAADGRTFSLDYVRLISGAGTIDSDGDGLPDNVETETFEFVGLRDTGSDPFELDTDMDGFDDGVEILAGTNPVDDQSFPTDSIEGYTTSPAVYALDEMITPNLPIVIGSNLISTSISPPLPAGLEIDDEIGEIRGTPTAISPATVYTITGGFASGASDTFELTLEVSNPQIIGYSANPAIYDRNTAITPNSPVLLGAAPVSFAVSPDLPAGLNLDTVSGEISGTPLGFGGPGDYTVTGFYNTTPDSSVVISIRVNGSPILTVDPADPISEFAAIGEFNTDGDLEGWAVGGRGEPHSASVSGGLATYATNPIQFPDPGGGDDPRFTKGALGLSTAGGANSIIEIRLRQNQSPPQEIQFFWGDASGGPSPQNSFSIPPDQIPDDNDFHVFQIAMEGVFDGDLTVVRLDPGNLANTTFDFDYVRVGSLSLPDPPRITEIEFNFLDEIEITWTSQEGRTYNLDASADLKAWAPLNSEPITASPGVDTTTFTDVTSPGLIRRYYRVVELVE
ncbi:MAG: putative Ig domain-containing protein [Verrucomicrobiales bacterium]